MYDLQRFMTAQADSYEAALAELEAGRKKSHWIWFIFPQLATLGRSHTAQFYGIAGLEEARAYLAHPILSERLSTCARAVLTHKDKAADAILGETDALKLRSSCSLFEAAGGDTVFRDILDRFYDGVPCALTLDHIGPQRDPTRHERP